MAANHLNALVLAGGINRIPLFEGYTPGYKALVPFQGRPSILYTLDALKAVPQIGRVCIAGAEAELRPALEGTVHGGDACDFAPSGETLRESIFNGLRHFAGSRRVLVLTADLPLITPSAIVDFLAACRRVDIAGAASLLLSAVPRHCYQGAYERFTKPFNRFRDVEICHGNLWMADPRLLENKRAVARINRVYNSRKNPLAEALAVGLRVGLAFIVGVRLLHALTLDQMTRLAGKTYGVSGAAVIVEHPEITIDVDEPDDYRFVVEQLGR